MSEEKQNCSADLPPLMSLLEVELATRLKKNKIYYGMRAGTFPLLVKIGKGDIAWRGADIQDWINARYSDKNNVVMAENGVCGLMEQPTHLRSKNQCW